mgnify:FL=1
MVLAKGERAKRVSFEEDEQLCDEVLEMVTDGRLHPLLS